MGDGYSLESLSERYGVGIGALFSLAQSMGISVRRIYDPLDPIDLLVMRSSMLDLQKGLIPATGTPGSNSDAGDGLLAIYDSLRAEVRGAKSATRGSDRSGGRLADLEKEMASLRDANARSSSTIVSLDGKMRERSETVGRLEREVQKRNERIASLVDEVSRLKIAANAPSGGVDQLKRQIGELKDEIALRDGIIEELERRVDYQKREIESLGKALYRRDQTIKELESERWHFEAEWDMYAESFAQTPDEAYAVQSVGVSEPWPWQDSPKATVQFARKRLHDRFEAAAERLFGSWQNPDLSRIHSERVERIKRLSFGDDHHPDCYADEDAIAYYTLRFEMGYAFEYYHMYRDLLSLWAKHIAQYSSSDSSTFTVVSVGAGQGLDLWGLTYAYARAREEHARLPQVSWTGVDMEEWPDRIIDSSSDNRIRYVSARIEDYLPTLKHMPSVLVFPKSLCELPDATISKISNWIRTVDFDGPLHYICIAHTDRGSLERYKVDESGYVLANYDTRQDAVKAAKILDALLGRGGSDIRNLSWNCNGLNKRRDYYVVRKECYYYSFFGRDVWFGDYDRNDEVFAPFGRHQRYAPVFGAVSRLFTRCKYWRGNQVGPWWQESSNCQSATCGNVTSKGCKFGIDRYPKVKTNPMAYQIYVWDCFDSEIPF